MDISNLSNEILVSENKHQYNHTYGINLSSVIDKQNKTSCHLCCLFALKCFHQFDSLNYSIDSNISYKNEKNYNAIVSSMDIWKDDINEKNYFKLNHSPLYDIPQCFHLNFLEKQSFQLNEQLYPVKVCYIE